MRPGLRQVRGHVRHTANLITPTAEAAPLTRLLDALM